MTTPEKTEQYEKRTMTATIPYPNNERNFILIHRIVPVGEGMTENVDVRRFFTSSRDGTLRPSKNGIHLRLDMLEDALAGIWAALTPDERKRCMARLKKVRD